MQLGTHLYYIFRNRIRFRRLGIVFGRNLKVFNRLFIKMAPNASIKIGDNFTFTTGAGYNPISSNTLGYIRADTGAFLTIGDNCGMSSTTIWVKESLTLGNHVLIGASCLIMDTDCHSLDWQLRGTRGGVDENGCSIDSINAKSAPIIIEDDVLIGARSIVLKGVTIGARSVIGAGSVVTHSIPSDCIAAGNPCTFIKQLNKND